eukprot:TRINITY_DN854_c0_g1_i2.p3 TRINITY_DN854_c0_g1~~TRINITY_DN854_c0_g1_i2.p3  ORF type:complete len:127 (+),score=16.60 TRINITY_DN854_c0_g1_i2:121-501(+)
MIRRPPRSTHCISSAASDVYKRQVSTQSTWAFTAFVGFNLLQSGFTGFCPPEKLLAKMGVKRSGGGSCCGQVTAAKSALRSRINKLLQALVVYADCLFLPCVKNIAETLICLGQTPDNACIRKVIL